MNYVIGIDGGGTSTTAILADEQGNVLARSEDTASNYHVVGKEQTAKVLSNLFSRLSLSSGLSIRNCRSVCIGMAGLGRADDQAIIRSICVALSPWSSETTQSKLCYSGNSETCFALSGNTASQNLILTHDAKIALVGGAMKNYGVILNSGTGAIAYGIDQSGKEARAGGWGHLLGDEGSGYDIAIHGLRAIVRAHDGRADQTLLTELMLGRLSLDSPDQLVRWIHSGDKKDIADLASLVFDAASKEDQVANEIIETAADELTLAAQTVIKKLDLSEHEFDVVLSGGVFENQPDFVETMQKRLKLVSQNAKIHLPIREPAYGAVMLAIERQRGK